MASSHENIPPKERVQFDRQYPISVSDTIGVDSFYQKLHYHDALEINLIKSGTGYYIINGERYEFGEGDIFIINTNDLHCAYETRDLLMQVVMFDPTWFVGNFSRDPEILSPFREIGLHFTNLLGRNHPKTPALRTLLLEMQEEHVLEQSSYESVVYAYMLQILAYINRHFRVADLHRPKDAVNAVQLEKIRHVLSTMEEQFAYPWTLKELASLAYLSPSRFSSLFRRTVEIPPLLYLIHLRLEQACYLLENTDEKIVDIAMECGFRTLSNFNRLFKRHIGMEPRNFRRKNTGCSKIVPVFERLSGVQDQ